MRMTVASGADAGQVVVLGPGRRLRIGRGRESDVVLHDPKVSRAHAELSYEPDGRVVLADLGSSNGTWVNGRRFQEPVSLRGDERLWIGDTVLELARDQASAGETRVAAPATESPMRRRASQISDIALLRPPHQPARTPSLAGTERTISRALIVGAVLLFGTLGGITLLIIGVETGPVAFAVAVGVAFLPVPFYLALVLWIDRNEREPTWMIVMTFFWGACVAVFIALILNSVGELVVGEAFGKSIGELYGFSISAPVVEESAKGLVLFIIYRRARAEFNGVLDGIVYAAIVGLGFAATENVLYYGRGIMEDLQDHHLFSSDDIGVSLGTFIVRGVFSPFAHPLFTAMTGIGLGIASRSTKRSTRFWAPVLGLLGAMFLHSLWNTSAIFGAAFFGVYLFVLVPLFVGLLFVIRGTLRRERQTIGQYLGYSVQQGELTPGELHVLTDGRLRKLALREAKAKGGKPGRRLRRAFHQAGAELAFLRERIARGLQPWDARGAEQHLRYEAAFRDARRRLGPLAFLPAFVFEGGRGVAGAYPAGAGYPAQAPQPVPAAPAYPARAAPYPAGPAPGYAPAQAASSPAPPPMPAPAATPPPPLPSPVPRDWWKQ
jgi:RsiW-degrading membrane proteinase PrsW (M82 family)/pSer/pThr/pTyr-binding forkhead associated (FHA) protein